MNKRNMIIAGIILVVAALAVFLLVPQGSGTSASASKNCNPAYGYVKNPKACKPKPPRPRLYKYLNIGDDEEVSDEITY